MSRRQSHGAHVTDVLAGRVPPSSRVGPSPGDRRDPPSWKLGTDIPSDSDIVFVQFSDACIRDATGVWLKAYVCDGIEYILSYADPTNTKKVVINVSYGPTTGPHDGTALLEAALTAFVTKYNGTSGKPKLEIVLPAGNSYLSEGHIAYRRRSTQPDQVEWVWRLPPDNSVLCFAEVWINQAKPRPCHCYAHVAQRGYLYIGRRSALTWHGRAYSALHRGICSIQVGKQHDVVGRSPTYEARR